jgi:hypothetical protein
MLGKLEQPLNIVGNATSIFSKPNGKLIDEYPTIRFNRGTIRDKLSQGSRWDFLATAEVNTLEYFNDNSIEFHTLIFTPKLTEHLYKIRKAKFISNIIHFPLLHTKKMIKILDSEPSTGFQILWYLNKIKNKDIQIFGFDWKETPTYYETRNKGKHNFELEKKLCLEYADKNGWKIYK